MSSSGGGGSTTRHVIEVMYQVTGLDKAGTGMTSFNSSLQTGQTTLDKFGASATKASTEATKLGTSINTANTPIAKTTQNVGKLEGEMNKTGGTTKKLTDFFRGNKGLIFSTTMLSSGIIEAIGMYQGWTDASEKLAAAKEKEADLLARGMEGTKEYNDAVRDSADAQRGFNFITRFTIQSFADLIPMSLMMTSSIIEMTSKLQEGAGMKAKLSAAGSKLITVFKGLTAASLQFIRTPIGIALAAVTAIFAAFATNAGGFRDRVNEIGVAIGQAVPQLQGFLTWLGSLSNGFFQSAAAAMGMSEKTTEALVDVEKEVLRTGDATELSIDEQIELYNKLGDEAENVSFSIGAHWKMMTDEIETHEEKYGQFVEAIQSGDDAMMQSMGLTAEEFKAFYKEWQAEIKEFEKDFTSFVDVIVENYKAFGEAGREAQEGRAEELEKLNKKLDEHYQKRESGEKMDKEARKKWEEDLRTIQGEIDALSEGLSQMAIDASDAWATFSKEGKKAIETFTLEALGGNFEQAITGLETALDNVPDKYKGNMAAANAIIGHELLSAESKADIFVANMDKLDPYKSFIVGAHEYTRTQAEVASGLDELAVAARANVTDMSQMDAAWTQFVASLSPAQKELPIVKSAIEGVDKGVISAGTAFGMLEAAGVTMSETLGSTVTRSFEDLSKTLIDLPGPMTAVFANIGGQVVKVGEVTDQSLITGPTSVTKSMEKTQTQAATLSTSMVKEMDASGTAATGFQTDATNAFNLVVTGINAIPAAAQKIPSLLKAAFSTEVITKAWDNFRNALGETGTWINQGVTKIAAGIKSAITIENFKDAWTGFWGAIAEGAQIVTSGISVLAKTIAEDIKLKALSGEWWKGFWDAMSSTVTWVAEGITAIGQEITGQITPEVAAGWWKGFQDAFASTAQWVGTGVQKIGEGITKTITPANAVKWWKGFQDALGSTAQWVGKGITAIGKGIISTIKTQGPTWWDNFRTALGVVGKWVTDAMVNVGNAILDFDWASIGSGIWTAIAGGITSAFKAGGDILSQLNPFEWGGKDKDIMTPISTNNSPFYIPPHTEVDETGRPTGNKPGQQTPQQQQQQMTGLMGVIAKVQQAFSTLSTSIATYSKSMTTNMGAFFTKMGAAFPLLDTQVKTHQQSWSTFSTSMLAYSNSMTANIGKFFTTISQALIQLDPAVKAHQATWSGFSTSILAYATSMTANIGNFFTTVIAALQQLDPAVKAHQATWSGFSTSVLAYSTSMTANLGTFFTTIIAALQQLDPAVKAHQATWSGFSTSIMTYAGSMTTNLGNFFKTIGQAFILLDQAVKAHHLTWSNFSTSIATYSRSMTTNISNFASSAQKSFGIVSTAVTGAHTKLSSMSTSVSTYMNSMSSKVNSFASAASSAFGKVGSSADAATKKVQALQKAINALKDKTVTITVNAKGAGLKYVRHGGSFINFGAPAYAQHGKSWIQETPKMIGGTHVSEVFPELITAIPLDPKEKNSPFHNVEMDYPMPSPKTLMKTGGLGGGSSPAQVSGDMYITIQLPNGEVLAKVVKPYLLQGYSGISSS